MLMNENMLIIRMIRGPDIYYIILISLLLKSHISHTGGDLTRTATIRFVSTNQTVTLQQTFVGEDVVGHLSMDTIIRGNVPNIAPGARLEVPDFSVEYRRTDPGKL